GSADVRDADAHAFDVTQASARADGPLLAEADVDAHAAGEVHIAVRAAEGRDDDGMGIGNEDRVGALELEPPAEGDADGDVVRITPVAHIGTQAEGERAIKREALAVAEDLGAEVATDQDTGATR